MLWYLEIISQQNISLSLRCVARPDGFSVTHTAHTRIGRWHASQSQATDFVYGFIMGIYFFCVARSQKYRYGLAQRIARSIPLMPECRWPFNHCGGNRMVHCVTDNRQWWRWRERRRQKKPNEFSINASDDTVLILINIRIYTKNVCIYMRRKCVVRAYVGLFSPLRSLIDRFFPLSLLLKTQWPRDERKTNNNWTLKMLKLKWKSVHFLSSSVFYTNIWGEKNTHNKITNSCSRWIAARRRRHGRSNH